MGSRVLGTPQQALVEALQHVPSEAGLEDVHVN